MKTLKDFTPEIKAKIPQYIKKYTKGVFDGGRYKDFDRNNAEELIHFNYERCGYKKPVVLVAGNPYEAQIYFNWITTNKEIYLPIIHILYTIKNNIKLDHPITKSQLDSQLYSQLGTYNNMYLFTCNIWSNVYFSWYKFIKDEFKIDSQINIDLDSFHDKYMKSGVYSAIFSELLCVVSKYPKKVHRDAGDRLHNTKGVAVEWENSCKETEFINYYIHGRNIPKEIAEIALNGELTKEVFIKEQNDEHRSAWYNYVGEERMLSILEAIEVDKFQVVHNNNEEEIITLFKTRERLNKVKNKPYAWLKRICPSTGNIYLTPTDPDFKTAEESAKFHRPDFVPMSVGYYWYSRS